MTDAIVAEGLVKRYKNVTALGGSTYGSRRAASWRCWGRTAPERPPR